MKTAPRSVLHTVADHYVGDALDFLERFDLLWEAMLHKMGRTKSFVDLLFACECALKAHIVLGRIEDKPVIVYKEVRRLGHNIAALADAADFSKERDIYQFMKDRLGPFSIYVRYSLDAYETFFPSAMERADASLNYSSTIGNHSWVMECRERVGVLLDSTSGELGGLVSFNGIIQRQLEMKAFVDACMR